MTKAWLVSFEDFNTTSWTKSAKIFHPNRIQWNIESVPAIVPPKAASALIWVEQR